MRNISGFLFVTPATCSPSQTVSGFLSGLESSGWLRHIQLILECSIFAAKVCVSYYCIDMREKGGVGFHFDNFHHFSSLCVWRERVCWYTAPMAGTGPLRPVLSFLCSSTLTTEHCMDSWYILLSLLRKLHYLTLSCM